ncbi:MAG: MopE-related protein [Myxococcota bacterium]
MRLAHLTLALSLLAACSGGDDDDTDTFDTDPDTDVECEEDFDKDGVCADVDCDDRDPYAYPGAPEIPYNQVDEDCDGKDLDDVDGDGFSHPRTGGDDCNDSNPLIYPGAPEECYVDLDYDCDGYIPEDDCDRDGFSRRQDCDDTNPDAFPGAEEIFYDGVDSDCKFDSDFDQDGDLDEVPWEDAWPLAEWPDNLIVWNKDEPGKFQFIPKGEAQAYWTGLDCADTDATVGGNLKEQWDGVDRNCDDTVDWLDQRDSFVAYVSNAGVADAAVGSATAFVGDLDGNGTGEFVVGDNYANSNAGRAYLIDSGQPNGKAHERAMAQLGYDPSVGGGGFVGQDVASAGDLNGDGKPEVIIGIPFYGAEGAGAAVIYDGEALSNGAGAWLDPDSALAWLSPGQGAGGLVATLGDLNGDGVSELATQGGYWSSSSLVTGGADAMSLGVFDGAEAGEGGVLGVGKAEMFITGDMTDGTSPSDMAGGVDINGDGSLDLAIGWMELKRNADNAVDCSQGGTGHAYLLDGTELVGSGIKEITDFERIDGTQCLGYTIGLMDDVDGDGYGEIVLADPGIASDAGIENAGRVWVVDGDDWLADTDVVTLASFTIDSPDGLTALRVERKSADHDGDGAPELLVGAPGSIDTLNAKLEWDLPDGEGSVYMFDGTVVAAGGTTDTSTAAARFYERAEGTMFGASWDVGDLDGDGGPDLMIGSPATGTGSAYLYSTALGIFAPE